jgi:antitoxin ParD1/3/4
MDTTILNISLPEPLRAFVEEQATQAGHGSASAYVESLVRAEQKRQAEARLEALLLEGLEGESVQITDEWWDKFRARLAERHRKTSAS